MLSFSLRRGAAIMILVQIAGNAWRCAPERPSPPLGQQQEPWLLLLATKGFAF
jgi:hypothetical protein